MNIRFISLLTMVFLSQYAWADDGIVSVASAHTVATTADRYESALAEKGFTVFRRIDHQQNAAAVGIALRPSTVIIFGNPAVGSKLMQCSQRVAIDLPQKAWVWEDAQENVWLSYNDPAYLRKRHNIKGCDGVLAKITKALSNFSQAAAGT